MGLTQFGNFHSFCRDSTLPVCNLFPQFGYANLDRLQDGCRLTGFSLSGGEYVGNLGSAVIAAIAILVTTLLLLLSERKPAAVGRREIQLFLLTFMLTQICEIFTVGMFPLNNTVRIVFTSIHLGSILSCAWILMLNAIVGFQQWEDGTLPSVGSLIVSAAILCLGAAYIALDTGLSWTGHFDSSLTSPNRNIGLYVLYLLLPWIFIFISFVLESILVLRVLGEIRPIFYLVIAALLFIIGQLFNYVASIHICNASSGKINGALFKTFFTLLSVVMAWVFWSSITEDDWPSPDNTLP
ncbi:Chitin synthase export chaperone [Golovinomyces cichoracearum]|uniref:Chitin synthase export chaperone n=1 Tax=Golovinomyces cichoracearum TaxID=62708 RepID=A0A420IUV2_9PEZI|nr:Chitin synthase export chaperone [Golovinomyces cichoracearum]